MCPSDEGQRSQQPMVPRERGGGANQQPVAPAQRPAAPPPPQKGG